MSRRLLLLPHLGMGDMLVLRGMVAALCDSCDRVLVVGLRKYRRSLECLFEDLAPKVALALVDSAADISPSFGAGSEILDAFQRDGYTPLLLGDHGSAADWRALDPLWPRALYLDAGLDPGLAMSRFALPESRADASKDTLAKVRHITGGKSYVLVHDDSARQLLLPDDYTDDEETVILHVDDARFASDNIFDYVDVIKHAKHLHAIDSCFALLADLAGLGTPTTVHAYTKDHSMPDIYHPPGRVRILRQPPQRGAYGAHLVPKDDEFGRALRAAFRHFAALQDLMRPTRGAWYPCGSYLMGPASMEYDLSMHAKQVLLYEHLRGKRNVLEIGVHGGHSLLMALLASPDSHVTCIDICGWEHTERCVEYLQAQFPGRVTLLVGSSRDVLPLVRGRFDVVHVDGDHSYEGAKFDMEQAYRLSGPDTVFVFDDYCGDIARAVDDLGLFDVIDVPSCSWNCLARRREKKSA